MKKNGWEHVYYILRCGRILGTCKYTTIGDKVRTTCSYVLVFYVRVLVVVRRNV